MVNRCFKNLFFVVLLAFAALSVSVGDAVADVKLRGSEVSVTYSKAVADEYMLEYPDEVIDVAGGSQGPALIQLVNKSCDIANSAISLAEQDSQAVIDALEEAKQRGINVLEIPVAIDCVDFMVNVNNPVRELTLEQLKGIYEGDITNWNEVGGSDMLIEVYHSGDGDHKMVSISKWLTPFEKFRADAVEVDKKLIFDAVAANVASIGYDGVYYNSDSMVKSPDQIASLEIRGPEDSSTATLAPSRKYPVSRILHMYIREGDTSAEAQNFLDYMFLPRSQRIIGEYVSPLMPSAGTFEIECFFGDSVKRSVKFSENLGEDIFLYIPYTSASEFTILAKNNTYDDGSYPKLVSYSDKEKTLENKGLLWVNRAADPTEFDGLLNCNVTELRSVNLEQGDVMTFTYNGKKVTVVFDEEPTDGGSSGCSAMGLGLAAAALLAGLAALRKLR